jgi:polyhydroxyalkanoate synthesis regulator phasin
MAEQSMELMHELLKQMNGTLKNLEEGQRLTNERLAAIEHHFAGFYTTANIHSEDMEALKSRVSRIENRLQLAETHD